jgi:hypothetical protein
MDRKNAVCGWLALAAGVSIDLPNCNPRVDDPRPFDHDRPMGVAADEAKNRDVARLWRPRDFDRVPHDAVEVPFRVAVKIPIRWIEWDLQMRDDAAGLIDLSEHHQAIRASALDPAHVVIGRA